MSKYLDSTGLSYLWNKLKSTFATKTEVSSEYNTLQGAINALQTSVAALTGLDSTNFGGFSIQSTEADAISNIATLYTADGYTDELLWYMAGTSLSSVKAYRYNGSGTPTAISSDTYNCVDFSGLIADVSTLSQNLAALGPKIDELKSNVLPFYNGLKEALLLLAEKVTYIDEDGQNYYDILYNALYVFTYPISYHLSHCVSSNNMNEIDKNAAYSAILTAADGYTLENASVVVKMGGNTITTTAYEDGEINIQSVSGPLEITVSAVSLEVVSISAVYTQSGKVENTDTLDVLKKDLIVTATFVGGVTAELNDDDYMLSGSLSAGESTITVQYGNVTDTFEVTVDEGVIGNNLVPFASLNMRPDSGISATFTNNELVYSLNNKVPWGSIAFEYKTNYLQTVLTNGKKYRFHANFELLSGNNVRFAMSLRKSDGASAGITSTIIYDSGEYIMEWVQTSSVGYIMLSLNEFTATYTAKLTDMWIKEVCED